MTARVVDLDPAKLTWSDLEEIEDMAGHPIASELNGGSMSIRTVKAMLCWALRQDDPTITIDTLPAIGAVELKLREGTGPLGSRSPRRRAASRPDPS